MKEKKVVEYVKTHKKEIALAVAGTVVGVVLFAITRKVASTPVKAVETVVNDYKEIDPNVINIGTITDLWEDEYGYDMIVNDVTIKDLGNFGQELMKLEGVTEETEITAMMGVLSKNT